MYKHDKAATKNMEESDEDLCSLSEGGGESVCQQQARGKLETDWRHNWTESICKRPAGKQTERRNTEGKSSQLAQPF